MWKALNSSYQGLKTSCQGNRMIASAEGLVDVLSLGPFLPSP